MPTPAELSFEPQGAFLNSPAIDGLSYSFSYHEQPSISFGTTTPKPLDTIGQFQSSAGNPVGDGLAQLVPSRIGPESPAQFAFDVSLGEQEAQLHTQDAPRRRRKATRKETPPPPTCPYQHCGYTAKTRRDVKRHYTSVHEKATAFFCTDRACSRASRGFARKDLRDRHVRDRHGGWPAGILGTVSTSPSPAHRGSSEPDEETASKFALDGAAPSTITENPSNTGVEAASANGGHNDSLVLRAATATGDHRQRQQRQQQQQQHHDVADMAPASAQAQAVQDFQELSREELIGRLQRERDARLRAEREVRAIRRRYHDSNDELVRIINERF